VVASDFAGDSMALWTQNGSSGRTLVFGRDISATGTLGPITYLGVGARLAVTFDDNGDGARRLAVARPYHRPQRRIRAQDLPIRQVRDQDPAVLQRASRRHRLNPVGHFALIWQQSSAPWPVQARFGP